ncbi:hypothetical protein ANCDUO_07515 [Ancylostoma duodenale]|uniref:Enoyl-CoA hydratase/isomerase family protein n=1 Tax=Ancylostoma duodenale TaxID=51022 RepID=A0A0C2CYU4_9BILA|nr:hypothetical protein ANCDUO_07515 [Ancylostoma duodenale]
MGIVPSWGGAAYLPSIVGRSSALHLMTTAPVLSSDEAMDIGYIDAIYEEDEEFEALVASMIKNGAGVCKAQKAMLNALPQGEDAQHVRKILGEVKEAWEIGGLTFHPSSPYPTVVRSVWGGAAQKAALQRQLAAVATMVSALEQGDAAFAEASLWEKMGSPPKRR